MIKIVILFLIFLSFPVPVLADELADYQPGWYAKVSYTIPAGGSWICIENYYGPDCPIHYVPYPAEKREDIQYLADWDVRITVRVVKTTSHLCIAGVFDSRRGKLSEAEAFRSWSGGNILNSCTILEKKPCEIEGFVPCIASKFSTKFPFDIIFNLPSTQITCPQVNFFGSDFDLCFIYEAFRLVKYPITAALVVKLFLYL